MRPLLFVCVLAACGGHKKVVGDGAPGGGAGSGSQAADGGPGGGSDSDYTFEDPVGGSGVAREDPPTAYSCAPGVPKRGVGCVCPRGFASRRTAGGEAVCEQAKTAPSGGASRRGVVDLDGDPIVVGAIPKDSIHKVVRDNFATIRQCYEQVLLQNPGVEGRVMVKMTVGIDGAVTDAAATGVHPALETCVAEKIRKFRFPRPDSGSSVEITYPFVFKAG